MVRTDVKALVIGGGLSGLSLGCELAHQSVPSLIIEPRRVYESDRTWSFWHAGPCPYETCQLGSWSKWAVFSGASSAVRTSHHYRYVSLDSGRVYDQMLQILGRSSVKLCTGTHAFGDAVYHPDTERWTVATSAGDITAEYVFDSRPQPCPLGTYGQYFMGQEIRTDRPAFDPDMAHIMVFRDHVSGCHIDFLYVLPFSTTHALMEVTRFAAEPPDSNYMMRWLQKEINAQLSDMSYSVIRREDGFLPMTVGLEVDTLQNKYVRIGNAGGYARPSTGYAFQRTLAASGFYAEKVVSGADHVRPQLDSALCRWMDSVFLRVIQAFPQQAPDLFLALFRRAANDRVERFLTEGRSVLDCLAIMTALPPTPFIRKAIKV